MSGRPFGAGGLAPLRPAGRASARRPARRPVPHTVALVAGDAAFVTDARGDARPGAGHGLVLAGTRFLSEWRLAVEGHPLRPQAATALRSPAGRLELVSALGLVVVRARAVGGGLRERITLVNRGRGSLELELRLDVSADFADARPGGPGGRGYRLVEGGRLVLGAGGSAVRETWVTPTAPEVLLSEDGLRFPVQLVAGGAWIASVTAVPAPGASLARGASSPRPSSRSTPNRAARQPGALPVRAL